MRHYEGMNCSASVKISGSILMSSSSMSSTSRRQWMYVKEVMMTVKKQIKQVIMVGLSDQEIILELTGIVPHSHATR